MQTTRIKISPARRALIVSVILDLESYLYGLRARPRRAREIILEKTGIDTAGVNIKFVMHKLGIMPHSMRGRVVRKVEYSGNEWDIIHKWLEKHDARIDRQRDTAHALARLATEFYRIRISTAGMREALKFRGIELPDTPRIIETKRIKWENALHRDE